MIVSAITGVGGPPLAGVCLSVCPLVQPSRVDGWRKCGPGSHALLRSPAFQKWPKLLIIVFVT
jgi:hypothetical protein